MRASARRAAASRIFLGAAGVVQYLRVVHVRQLRQRIEASPDQPRHIITETGVGYRLKADE